MTLGQRITRARAAHRLSQNDLAEALEVSRLTLSKWQTDASVPELDKVLKLCQLFLFLIPVLLGRILERQVHF